MTPPDNHSVSRTRESGLVTASAGPGHGRLARPGLRGGEAEDGGTAQHGGGQPEGRAVGGRVDQEAPGHRADHRADVARHLVGGDQGPAVAVDDVPDHRGRGHVQQAGAEAGHGHRGQVGPRAGQQRQHHHADGRDDASGDDDRAPAEGVGHPPAGQQRGAVQRGEQQEPDARPDRRPVQDLPDEQRHQGTAHAERGEAIGQVGRRGSPPGAAAHRAGQRGQRAGRRCAGRPRRFGTRRSTTAARIAGTTSRQP